MRRRRRLSVVSDHGAIDEQVRQLVISHRPELERLVDHARELNLLVEERLAAGNGNGAHETVGNAAAVEQAAVTKTCAGLCDRALPLSAFDKGRATCRSAAARRTATASSVARPSRRRPSLTDPRRSPPPSSSNAPATTDPVAPTDLEA